MIGLITTIGVLLLVASVIVLILKQTPLVKQRKDRYGDIVEPDLNLDWASNSKLFGTIGVAIILFFIAGSLIYIKPGHQYYIVYPTGKKIVHIESGYKFIMPFSRVQEWEKYIDIRAMPIDSNAKTDGVEGIIANGIPIRFIDKVTGDLMISVRIEIPSDPESFIKLAEEFRHPLNLVNNTLIPTIREQAINTGYMFSAEDYVSGEASNFRQTLDEQLMGGGYAVNKLEIVDTIFNDITDLENPNAKRTIKEINVTYKVTKRKDKNGNFIRIPHDITENNIIISQVIVDDLELDPTFAQKLETQRDISAQRGIEVGKIELAQIAQQKIVAEGERDKAAERVKREKEQVSKLISIETAVKEEESKRQLAEIALKTAELNKKKAIVDADAKAYEIAKADGVSEELKLRLQMEKDTRIGVAKALAGDSGIKLPSTTINGSTNGQQDLTTLLLLKMLENK